MNLNEFEGAALLEHKNHRILFGCPPEIHKSIMKNKLHYPNIIVCSDTVVKNGITFYSPEFVVMGYLFMEGNFNFSSMSIKKMKVIGTKEQITRFKEILRITFLGPSNEEYIKWNIDKKKIEMLQRESNYFFLKDKTGHAYDKIDDYIEECPFDSKGTYTIDNQIIIKKSGLNKFQVENDGDTAFVDIDFDGEISPVWQIPEIYEIEPVSRFSLRIIGAASGFNFQAPSTTYLLSLNNQFYLWDCAPFCSRVLSTKRGLSSNQITGIIISHIHDDHCNDLIPFTCTSTRKIDIVTSDVVWNMMLVKLSNMMDTSEEKISNYFNWIRIDVEEPKQLNGALFNWHYGVHSIPSLGATISFKGKTIIISGDTGSKSVLDKMMEKEAINKERYDSLNKLLNGHVTSFVDCGEAIIHGTPNDFKNVEDPHEIIFSHRSNLPEGFSKFNLAEPGKLFVFRESEPSILDGVLIERMLLKAGVADRKWGEIFTLEKICMQFSSGEVIISEDSEEKEFFYIISQGIVKIYKGKNEVATLEKGSYFGHQSIINDHKTQQSTILAISPVRLLAIRSRLFKEMIQSETDIHSILHFSHMDF